MRSVLTRFLVLGTLGLCFIIVGALNDQYPVIALGGSLVIDSVYGLGRQRRVMIGNRDQKRQRRSFVLAGLIGASLAIANFASHSYLLAAAGTAILIGSLVQLHWMTPNNGH